MVRNDRARSNETRFEHIAKKNHQLKVRDIELIPEGINEYAKKNNGTVDYKNVACVRPADGSDPDDCDEVEVKL